MLYFPELAFITHSKAITPAPFWGFSCLIKPKSNKVSNISQSTVQAIPSDGIGTLVRDQRGNPNQDSLVLTISVLYPATLDILNQPY